jgi:tetratricopeptide (TPR) repeat protein
LVKRALAIYEKAFGPDNSDVARLLNNLAEVYITQGRYDDAEPLQKRALAIREQVLGRDHPDVAESLNNLANLYQIKGRYADAEPLYVRVLANYEKAPRGANYPSIATPLNNLARLYWTQGRYAEAETLDKRALEVREKAFGPNHPDVAESLNNLALVYDNQGRYSDAEPFYKRALAIFEKALGPDHPSVAISLSNLAAIYLAQGRYSDAEALANRALAIREKSFAPNNPEIANSLNNLATVNVGQRRYSDAEPLYQRALAVIDSTLGRNHPYGALLLNNVASLYGNQGRFADAYTFIRQTFASKSSSKEPSFSVILGAQRSQLLTPEQSFADSFNVLQFTSSSAASEAVQKLAQRYAAGTNDLAKLVRRDQDLLAEAEAIDKTLIAAVSKDPKERNQANEDGMRARLSEISSERSKITTILSQRFPDYVALSRPEPLTVKETQSLLSDDEAVLAIDIGDKSYAWVITNTGADWTDIPANSKTLNGQIATIRQSLTFDVDKPFDAALAYQIYQQTLGPIADVVAGGATRSRGGSWRSRMRRGRWCPRWRAGTACRRNIFLYGARRRVPACSACQPTRRHSSFRW